MVFLNTTARLLVVVLNNRGAANELQHQCDMHTVSSKIVVVHSRISRYLCSLPFCLVRAVSFVA